MRFAKPLDSLTVATRDEQGDWNNPSPARAEHLKDYDIYPSVCRLGERYFHLRRHRMGSLLTRFRRRVRQLFGRNR